MQSLAQSTFPKCFDLPVAQRTEFDSLDTFHDAVDDWSIMVEFHYRVTFESTKHRRTGYTKKQIVSCKWFVYTILDLDDTWAMKTVNAHHICVGAGN